MPIVLDPSKNFVQIRIFYTEEKSSQGETVYKFITTQEEMKSLRESGFAHESEVKDLQQTKKEAIPGMPVGATFDPAKIIYSINTKWKRMLWRDHNVIYSKCYKIIPNPDGTTRAEFDSFVYRDLKIKQCLKEWDLKDERGLAAPVTPEAIDSLLPDVAIEMLNAFERYTEATNEELGE